MIIEAKEILNMQDYLCYTCAEETSTSIRLKCMIDRSYHSKIVEVINIFDCFRDTYFTCTYNADESIDITVKEV